MARLRPRALAPPAVLPPPLAPSAPLLGEEPAVPSEVSPQGYLLFKSPDGEQTLMTQTSSGRSIILPVHCEDWIIVSDPRGDFITSKNDASVAPRWCKELFPAPVVFTRKAPPTPPPADDDDEDTQQFGVPEPGPDATLAHAGASKTPNAGGSASGSGLRRPLDAERFEVPRLFG